MKIVRIDGGLGNQMFCYAFALALQQSSGEEVLVDTHRYTYFPNHQGYELSKVFGVNALEATPQQLWKVTYPAYSLVASRIFQRFPHRKSEIVEVYEKCYPNLIEECRDGYYIGNWQWYKYFDKIRPLLLNVFSFKPELDSPNKVLVNKIKEADNYVSIHIRRGDYLWTPSYCGICTLDFYVRAINKARDLVKGKVHFLIFSNDMDWCRENILPLLKGDEAILVDWNIGENSYKDMQLMNLCRGNIIANSSFSWWGAYLNNRDDKFVVAPDKWINRPLEYRIQCDEWICL